MSSTNHPQYEEKRYGIGASPHTLAQVIARAQVQFRIALTRRAKKEADRAKKEADPHPAVLRKAHDESDGFIYRRKKMHVSNLETKYLWHS